MVFSFTYFDCSARVTSLDDVCCSSAAFFFFSFDEFCFLSIVFFFFPFFFLLFGFPFSRRTNLNVVCRWS